MEKRTAFVLLAVLLSGSAAIASVQSDKATQGRSFAQANCAACHAVSAGSVSPNPEAPPFPDIANRTGVTESTLQQFLKDSHNFPAAMNFRVDPDRISQLSAYMMTLQQAGYRPAP